MENDFLITFKDLMKHGFCGRGQRQWFADMGINYEDFLKNGMMASTALATGDGMAQAAVEKIGASRG